MTNMTPIEKLFQARDDDVTALCKAQLVEKPAASTPSDTELRQRAREAEHHNRDPHGGRK